MDEKLKRRLAGAGVLLIPAFVLVSLLPTPDEVATPEGVEVVTIPLYEERIDAAAPPSAVAVPPSLAAPSVADGDGTATQDVEGSGDEDASADMPLDAADDAAMAAVPEEIALAPAAPVSPVPTPAATPPDKAQPVTKPAAPAPAPAPAPAKPVVAVPATPTPAPTVKPAPAPPDLASPEPKKSEVTPADASKPPPVAAAKPAAPPRPASSESVYVQVGGFADIGNARQAQDRLKAIGQASLLSPVETAQGTLYRVRIGPFASRDAAQPVLARATANGFAGAKIVAP